MVWTLEARTGSVRLNGERDVGWTRSFCEHTNIVIAHTERERGRVTGRPCTLHRLQTLSSLRISSESLAKWVFFADKIYYLFTDVRSKGQNLSEQFSKLQITQRKRKTIRATSPIASRNFQEFQCETRKTLQLGCRCGCKVVALRNSCSTSATLTSARLASVHQQLRSAADTLSRHSSLSPRKAGHFSRKHFATHRVGFGADWCAEVRLQKGIASR